MAEAQLARMLAEVRGRESVDALFARLTEALDRLPQIEHEPKRIMLSEQLRKSVAARLPVADAWEAWLHSPRKRMPSAVTLDGYYAYWGRDEIKKHGRQSQHGFKNWLATQHQEVTFLDEITPGIAEEYATHLWRSGIAPRTYNGVIKFLRGMFKVLRSRAGLVTNVWEDIPAQDNNTEGRRNLTPQELAKVCSKAEGDLRYWLAIGLYTGLRLGDVVTLRWAELDFSAHVIRRIPNKTKRKGKVITFPLHPVLEAMLRELREATDPDQAVYLFPKDASRHQNGQSSALTGRIQNHFIKCGIDTHREGTGGRIKRDEEGKPIRDDKGAVEILQSRKRASVEVGFHSLRHSFVSLCAANRVPQVAIQELVGHGSPAMTALYSHAGDEQKADAIAALPVVSFYHEEKEK
jgi:integrase